MLRPRSSAYPDGHDGAIHPPTEAGGPLAPNVMEVWEQREGQVTMVRFERGGTLFYIPLRVPVPVGEIERIESLVSKYVTIREEVKKALSFIPADGYREEKAQSAANVPVGPSTVPQDNGHVLSVSGRVKELAPLTVKNVEIRARELDAVAVAVSGRGRVPLSEVAKQTSLSWAKCALAALLLEEQGKVTLTRNRRAWTLSWKNGGA